MTASSSLGKPSLHVISIAISHSQSVSPNNLLEVRTSGGDVQEWRPIKMLVLRQLGTAQLIYGSWLSKNEHCFPAVVLGRARIVFTPNCSETEFDWKRDETTLSWWSRLACFVSEQSSIGVFTLPNCSETRGQSLPVSEQLLQTR